jgi:hypothetical protein
MTVERLREAFPAIGRNGTVPVDGELQARAETGAIGAAQVSDANERRPEASADR